MPYEPAFVSKIFGPIRARYSPWLTDYHVQVSHISRAFYDFGPVEGCTSVQICCVQFLFTFTFVISKLGSPSLLSTLNNSPSNRCGFETTVVRVTWETSQVLLVCDLVAFVGDRPVSPHLPIALAQK